MPLAEYSQIAFLITATKVIQVLVGLAFAYFGYRLFRHGVYEKAGDLRAAWGERYLVLKQAAPGTFFALFGAAVIAVSIWRGIEINIDRARETAPRSSVLRSEVVTPPARQGSASSGSKTAQQAQETTTSADEQLLSSFLAGTSPAQSLKQQEVSQLVERLLSGAKLTLEESEKIRSWFKTQERERGRFIGEYRPSIQEKLRLGAPREG